MLFANSYIDAQRWDGRLDDGADVGRSAGMLALCDCDNFFVSCERLERPDLARTPAVVLSSNDGCIIARSAEAKAMGIRMGEPYFRVAPMLRARGVAVFSGRLPYYRAVSAKVMAVVQRYTDALEQYSIDEAFISVGMRCVGDRAAYAREIRCAVMRETGVPISVGVAPTKTLAKIATRRAKGGAGVFEFDPAEAEALLDSVEIGDVWGVGHRHAAYLRAYGVRSALDLARRDPLWVRKHLTVRGSMTQLELQGTACLPIDTRPHAPKSIQSSHAFGGPLYAHGDIARQIEGHAAKAGRMMRTRGMAAGAMSVFLLEGYYSREHRFVSAAATFTRPTRSDAELSRAAAALLRELYRPGSFYTRAGLTLHDLSDARYRQRELFSDDRELSARSERLARASQAVDRINAALGRRAVYPASLAAV